MVEITTRSREMHKAIFAGEVLALPAEMDTFAWNALDWFSHLAVDELGDWGRSLQEEISSLLGTTLLTNEAAQEAITAQTDRQSFGKAVLPGAKEVEATLKRNELSANFVVNKLAKETTSTWVNLRHIALQVLDHLAHKEQQLAEMVTQDAVARQKLLRLDTEGHEEVVQIKADGETQFKHKERQDELELKRLKRVRATLVGRMALLDRNDDKYWAFATDDTAPKALDASLAIPLAA